MNYMSWGGGGGGGASTSIKATNIYETYKSQIKKLMPPLHGEDNVLFISNRSAVSLLGRAEMASSGSSSSSQVAQRTTITLRPPLTGPSDNYHTNDGYILRDHNSFRRAGTHFTPKRCAQKETPPRTRCVFFGGEKNQADFCSSLTDR